MLIHGIGSSWRAWVPVLPALEAAHDVIALDLPGFGDSPPLPPGVTHCVPTLADAVERELDSAGLADYHVAGNSMGGWIGLELARRGRARSLVAISPAGMGSSWERRYARAALTGARALSRLLAPVAGPISRLAPARTAFFSLGMSRPWRLEPEAAAHATRALGRAPGWKEALDWLFDRTASDLERIDVPVLIAWGGSDRLLFPGQGRRFAERLPNAELRELPGLGHVPMSDDPELVASAILEFTGRHPFGRGGEAGRVP